MRLNPFAAAAILALVLALGLAARIFSQHRGFREVVNQSLATSEGYDQKFIDLVNHLEDVLVTRASFPFTGGKDPMTGRRREVAQGVLESAAEARPEQAPRRRAEGISKGLRNPRQPRPAVLPVPKPDELPDPVRLTAIIADDYGQHTAIVMDGERSQSVDVGDTVGDRKVAKITSKELTMEDDSTVYTYSLSGMRGRERK